MYFNTYVINLESYNKRYEVQKKKLNDVGIYPTRINAYYKKNIEKSEIKKYFGYFSFLYPDTMIGCNYSHLQAVKYFLENDTNDVALILEDDAFPLFSNVSEIRKKLTNINWDMLSLHCDGLCPTKVGRPYLFSGSAAAYFITREGARKLLKHKLTNYIDRKTNDIKSSCPSFIKGISPYFMNRGEKTLCHFKNYKAFKIPGTNKEITNSEIVLILSCIFSLIIIKKTLLV